MTSISSTSTSTTSSFTRAVISAMRRLYPEELADKSWDNTGLLLEAPLNHYKQLSGEQSVLLTIDLTTAVADEAIERGDSVIVAYHPIIFRPLKSLTFGNTQQSSLLRLAAEGISVYCPHTAVDSAAGGNADWLAGLITGKIVDPSAREGALGGDAGTSVSRLNNLRFLQHFPSSYPSGSKTFRPCASLCFPATAPLTPIVSASIRHTSRPIFPREHSSTEGHGRLVQFPTPQSLPVLLTNLQHGLKSPPAFQLAVPHDVDPDNFNVRSVAICAGSGSDVLAGAEDADLLVTGEMSHHAALAAIEQGKVVVCLTHSGSERGYLQDVMAGRLTAAIKEEGFSDGSFSVDVSLNDKDPFGFVVAGSLE